jgi:mono/diheme cytochrome c family protein
MKRFGILSVAAALLVGTAGSALAEGSVGESEYMRNCVSCHGKSGSGDGPFAEFLKHGVPALNTIQKNNGGVFPFDRIHKMIDGRGAVKGHGGSEMPIWGDQYRAESVKTHGPFFGDWYSEDIINARILALIEHISTLQK